MSTEQEDPNWAQPLEELITFLQLEFRIGNLEKESQKLDAELNGLENKLLELKGRILADDIEEYLRGKEETE